MIEVIYKDEKQEPKGGEGDFSAPKNIRQIGLVSDSCRIYMEDYVYTFLLRSAETGKGNAEQKSTLAVLTGETRWASGVTYVFVKGAVAGECEELSSEHIEFTDALWKQIHEETEAFFSGQEIVGWFFGEKSLPMEAGEVFERIHRKHFGGEKVLMLMDPGEREDAFFRYENNFLVRQSGYYLYYEKNPRMQAYMAEKNSKLGLEREEEVPDEAVKTFRKIIQKKNIQEKETEESRERSSVFSYAATACLALAVVAAGIRFYQNYQAMQEINAKTETVSAMIRQEETSGSAEDFQQKKDEAQQLENRKEADVSGDTEISVRESNSAVVSPEETSALISEEGGQEEEKRDAENQETVPKNSDTEKLSEEDAAIYKEESDARKAERRVRELRESAGEDRQPDTGTDTSGQTEAAAVEDGKSYIIRPGDTLYQISVEQYGTMEAVSEICRVNELSEDEIIYPGQIIVLP